MYLDRNKAKSDKRLASTLYRPLDSSKYLKKDFDIHLKDMLSSASESSKDIILLGDVNVNYLASRDNKEFKSILNLFGFK